MTDSAIDVPGGPGVPGRPADAPAAAAVFEPAELTGSAVVRTRRVCLAAMTAVATAVFVATLLGAKVFPGYSYDMRQYVTDALMIDGEDRTHAVADAAEAWCWGRTDSDDATRLIIPILARRKPDNRAQCVRSMVVADTDLSPRYTAIFSARVGVSVMYAPFLAALGTFRGMWVAAAAFAVAGGLLTAALVGALGGSVKAALAGQILYAVLPVGGWAAQPLSEGPVDVLLLIALAGAALVLHGARARLGVVLLVSGLAAMVTAKESTATVLCAGLLAAAGACLTRPALRRRATVLVVLVAGLGLAATAAWSSWRGDPGLTETVQELFTVCFSVPDVSHPWGRLLRLNEGFWLMEARRQAIAPFGAAALAASGWLLWSTSRRALPLLTVPLVIAAGTICVHPHIAEAPRLLSTAWITCAVAFALAVDRLRIRTSRGPEGS